MEDGERPSQPHFEEYDLLGPDLTKNTQGQYILIFSSLLITPTRMAHTYSPKLVPHYPPSDLRLIQSVYDRTFSAIVR